MQRFEAPPMAYVKIYLKPRPTSLIHGHSNYLPFKQDYYCEYGPFFADYGAVPSDATQVHTLQSPGLSTALSVLYNVLIPSLDVEVPDPNKSDLSAWLSLRELANVKVTLAFDSRIKSENHIVQLSQGDRAPAPPPRKTRAPVFSPEWYEIVFSTMDRGDVELHDVSRDTELELFIWVYIHKTIDEYAEIWRNFRREMRKLTDPVAPARLPSGHVDSPGLLIYLGRKALTAVAAFSSSFIADASVNDTAPPLLPSSSTESSTTYSTSSFDTDDLTPDRQFEPLRRRKRMILSEPSNQ
ncbi:hypothetical protein EDD18DRAFT_1401604 [Armillaria luteobubalina]|uniref:Uncharacterized protein n=1 Tax=Armillaria luteobubalina TaxID=153913 RepID=A0AA39NXF1_9AGAR|nr:hypothetical protein EDD18DRAFT_1401604 [Armillaria luteobubalina]